MGLELYATECQNGLHIRLRLGFVSSYDRIVVSLAKRFAVDRFRYPLETRADSALTSNHG